MYLSKIILLSILFLANSEKIFSQNLQIIDSLKNTLETSKIDTHKVYLLNELAFELRIYKPNQARNYAEEALSISNNITYYPGIASAYMRKGSIELLANNYKQSERFFLRALDIRINEIGIKTEIASTYNNLGLLYYYQGNDAEAIKYYQQGLEVLKNENQSNEEAMLCINIADSYTFLSKYQDAIKFLNRGIEIMKDLNDQIGIAESLLNLGNWYSIMGNLKKAKESFESSYIIFRKEGEQNGQAKCLFNLGNILFEQGKYEEALQYFTQALNLKAFLDAADVASIHRSRGNIFKNLNRTEDALDEFLFSLNQFIDLGNPIDIASMQYNIGILHKENLKFKKALSYFEKSQIILDTINDPIRSMKLAQAMSETHAKLKNTDLAYLNSKKHIEIQDTLTANFKNAMNYQLDYEEEKRKNQLQVAENNHKNFIIKALIAGGIFWILFSIVTMIAYNNRQKRRIAEQDVAAAYLEIDDLLNEQQLQVTYAKLEGQDEERKRIAQDLHDRVGSILSTVILYFKGIDSKLDAIQSSNENQFIKANDLLHEAVGEVRKISQNIHSGTLTKFGLKAELEALSKILEDSNRIKVKIVTHGLEERIPAAMEINVYRIIQELVSNVLKHASASKIIIQVNEFEDILNILVQDDGKGFDIDVAKKKGNMGLRNIESRVYDMHGSIIIDSGKGNGTTVTIDIPIEN